VNLSLFLIAACGAAATAQQKAILDPAKAGPDFAIQGEYAGELERQGARTVHATQIIALGGGKFHAVGYVGGFPGEGWDGSAKLEADGQTKDGVTILTCPGGSVEVKGDTLIVRDTQGRQMGTMKKVLRKSPTLGAKPPAGAVVLFDGTSAEGWKGGRMTPDGLLMEGATSARTFQSFTLHLEFMLSFMPDARGQGRSNSGCYLQGRYEVQILDSFGLAGEHNECGGIYSVAKPGFNMCYPPLSWQTYDVDVTAAKFDAAGKKTAHARLTVRHNGVTIHRDVEVDHATTAAPLPEGPEPGPVFIQDHGNPLRFRNIWVVEKR
jgi:hypothetical protein